MKEMMKVSPSVVIAFLLTLILHTDPTPRAYSYFLPPSTEKKLYCIYVAIGQKRSTVAQIVKRLTDNGTVGINWN